jgi:hypothetical protein
VLQGGAEERFTRQKHHDHLRGVVERFPVALAAQLVHVLTNLPGMRLQLDRSCFVVCGFLRVQKGLERRFRIDDDALAAWQVNDEIRAQASAFSEKRRLLVKVAPLDHSRNLDDASQLHFTPAPSDRRRA